MRQMRRRHGPGRPLFDRGELSMPARICLTVLALVFALVALSGVAVFVDHTREMRKERQRTDATAVKPADDPWPECAAIREDLVGKEIVAWERRGSGVFPGQTMVKVHSRSLGKPPSNYYTTIYFGSFGPNVRDNILGEIWGPLEEYYWMPPIVSVLLDIGLGGLAFCALLSLLKWRLPERAFRFVGVPLSLVLAAAYGAWVCYSGLGVAKFILVTWARSDMALRFWYD
jgi:hypothetical protein